ncbi:MAG: hypothetical protein IJS95_00785 [Prevotella sp.]|nr:hypothetical protein [Prevotella sp.]
MVTMTISRTAQRALALQEWWNAKSQSFTALCGTEGDVFTLGDVVKAHLCLAAVLILIGIGGAL